MFLKTLKIPLLFLLHFYGVKKLVAIQICEDNFSRWFFSQTIFRSSPLSPPPMSMFRKKSGGASTTPAPNPAAMATTGNNNNGNQLVFPSFPFVFSFFLFYFAMKWWCFTTHTSIPPLEIMESTCLFFFHHIHYF